MQLVDGNRDADHQIPVIPDNEGPIKGSFSRKKKEYPVGTRVELVRMDDPHAPPVGTRGTVTGVDDITSILVNWDSGSRLNVLFGEDEVRKV